MSTPRRIDMTYVVDRVDDLHPDVRLGSDTIVTVLTDDDGHESRLGDLIDHVHGTHVIQVGTGIFDLVVEYDHTTRITHHQ